MGINNSLLKSIQTLVDKAINIAPFDKTRQAQIITNNGDGTYTIRLDGILYNNIPSYPIFNGLIVGTIVKVVIPSNQTSQMYVQPSKGGDGGEHRELTQAEYNTLSPSEKHNGTVYFITDADPDIPVINDSVPIGAIQAYGGQTAPYGWLICDGSAIRRDTYSELFDVIGVTYGTGDGSTTFNLPDLRGRVGIGSNSTYLLGDSGGEATHTLDSTEIPAHNHVTNAVGIVSGTSSTVPRSSYNFTMTNYWNLITVNASSPTRYDSYGPGNFTSNNTGGSQAHNNMQPYVVTNYIIKAKEPTLVTATVPPLITDFIDVFYPVGSYYESSDASFNPNASWGGTWEITNGGIINGSPQTMTKAYQSSSDITTTTYTDLISFTFTSKTGKIWFFGDATIKTSRYTSGLHIMVNGSDKAGHTSNIQSAFRLTAISECEVPINTPITISLRMTSQDTGTTATCCGYSTSHLFVSDIPVITGYCWHRTA